MLRHFEGLFELILRLMPLFDASETLLDVARAANICVFRGTAPLGAYQRALLQHVDSLLERAEWQECTITVKESSTSSVLHSFWQKPPVYKQPLCQKGGQALSLV